MEPGTYLAMKIGHFPTPYADELLYSICARFATRADYPSVKAVLEELFGATTATAVIDLPNRLGWLAAALPENSSLTADRLIDRHTLLPFFSAFQPATRITQLRDDLKGTGGPAGHMRSGMMASRIPMPEHLRFCPACKREDEECFGETYWHRLHQLPGVEVCPSHQAFLENSSVSLRAGRKHLQFILADRATRAMPVRLINSGNQEHDALLNIARDAEWLLEHPNLCTSLKALHGRYLPLLVERGLATYTGSIHAKKLLDEFNIFYSPLLQRLLHCEFIGSDIAKTNWLLRLVRPHKHVQHPLYHLLLIQFLGCTVEKFFQLPEELSPFGEGPWPCLNPAADHYRQPVIMNYQPGDRLRYGKPSGRFSCECGFGYVRTGPDSSPEDRFCIGRMISFGQIWEVKLIELWKDSSLSLSEIGKQLGVDPLTVRRHAVRLKLPFLHSSRKSKSLKRAAQLKGSTTSAAREKKRHTCRSKWLSLMRRNPKIAFKALRQKLSREYAWLLQNDAEWLEGHKPRLKRRNLSTTSVDWKKRDAEYTIAVKTAASRIMNFPAHPAQVTKTAVGRAVGAITLLQQRLHKMPLTAQVLTSVVETREQYAVRRVWWTADLYCQEDASPREWQLIMRANVYSLRDNSAVRCAIEDAMRMLELKLSQGQAGRAASYRA
jgi:hypothetical protein